jgi:hypothetical protein
VTYTYVLLEVPKVFYDQVRTKLVDAGYNQAVHDETEYGECLDMHGIALVAQADEDCEEHQ